MAGMRNILLALGNYHHRTHRGVARYARQHNWHLVADMAATSQIPSGWSGDGIITALSFRQDLVDFVCSSDVPKVDLSLTRPEIDIPRVLGDNELIGRMAAEHLLDRGFKHFTWFGISGGMVPIERYNGFSSRLQKAGYDCRTIDWDRDRGRRPDTWANRRQWLIECLDDMPRPLAVFAYNDHLAANVIDACLQATILVPEEVAVIGVDSDDLVCECLSVPLTSVNHDLERLGYEGAALLDLLMDGSPPPKKPIRIKPKGVVMRKSTDIIAVAHLQVATSLRFIRENYNRAISVDDIVSSTAMSRRGLEKAFHTHLGRSINAELRRVRLDQVRRLLVETETTVIDISSVTGFSSPQYLCNVFKHATGMTPREFRDQGAF